MIIDEFDGKELRGYFISGAEDLHSGSAYLASLNFLLPARHEDFRATNLVKVSFMDAENPVILETDDLVVLKKTRKGRLQGNLLRSFAGWVGIRDVKPEEINPE